MILDAGLLFTGNFAATSYPAKYADNITSSGNSSFFIDLAQGQTNTNAAALPPSSINGSNATPFRDIGIGDDPALKILIQAISNAAGTGFAGGTSLAVNLQASPDNGVGAPAGFVTYYSSPVTTIAALNQSQRLMDMDMPRPPAGIAEPRFLQLSYTIVGPFTGTTNFILGTLVLDRADQVYNALNNAQWGGYPAGVTVAN